MNRQLQKYVEKSALVRRYLHLKMKDEEAENPQNKIVKYNLIDLRNLCEIDIQHTCEITTQYDDCIEIIDLTKSDIKEEISNDEDKNKQAVINKLEHKIRCVYCLENHPDILNLPCRHMITCEKCWKQKTDRKGANSSDDVVSYHCALCRRLVTYTCMVYLP